MDGWMGGWLLLAMMDATGRGPPLTVDVTMRMCATGYRFYC